MASTRGEGKNHIRTWLALLVALITAFTPAAQAAVPTLAGTPIQASARLTYELGPKVMQALSNVALNVVREAHAIRMTTLPARIGAPGTGVVWPVNMINASNVVDTAVPVADTFAGTTKLHVNWYYDLDGDGRLTGADAPLSDTDGDGTSDTGPLSPGQSIALLASVQIPAGTNLGEYPGRFVGYLTGDPSARAVPPVTLTVDDQAPFIEIKNAPAGAYIGESYSFQIHYGNTGTKSVPNATIDAPLPPGASVVSTSPAAVYSAATRTLTWTLGSLAPGAEGTLRVQLRSAADAVKVTALDDAAYLQRGGVTVVSAHAQTTLANHYANRITLSVNPSVILGDGKSQGVLTARVVDALGNPVFDQTIVHFEASKGTFKESGEGTMTSETNAGAAVATLIAPLLTGLEPAMIPVTVTAWNPDDGWVQQTIRIHYSPGAVVGRLISSSTGLPESGIEVDLMQNGHIIVSTTTDISGYYLLVAPAIGTYSVRVVRHPQSNVTETFDLSTHVPEVNDAVTFGPSVIRGRLVDRATGLGVPNTQISIYTQNGELLGEATTDADGNYVVVPKSPQNVQNHAQALGDLTQASFRAQGYTDPDHPQWVVKALAPDGRFVEQSIPKPEDGDIILGLTLYVEPSGRVIDAVTKKPIAGAKVYLQWANPAQFGQLVSLGVNAAGVAQNNPTVTAASGFYGLQVTPGYYRTVVSAEGHQTYTSEPFLLSGDRFSQDMALQPLPEANLHLVKSTANPSVQPGAPVHFVLRLSNSGPTALGEIAVQDVLPAGVDYVAGSADGGGTFDAGTRTLHWSLPALLPGAEHAVAFGYDVTPQSAANGQAATNLATAQVVGHTAYVSSSVTLHIARRPSISAVHKVDRSSAAIGDIVHYAVRVLNDHTGPNPMPSADTRIEVQLPAGFTYLRGSSQLNGVMAPDPQVNGPTLSWAIGDLPVDAVAELTYAAAPGVAALGSDGVAQAYVEGVSTDGFAYSVGPEEAGVRVAAGLFGSLGTVVGTVFVDADGNGRMDPGEVGLAGAVLYSDDGRRVVTGDGGRYSIAGVAPGLRSLKLDRTSVPRGLWLAPLASGKEMPTARGGDARFVTVYPTGLGVADFPLRRGTAGVLTKDVQATLTLGAAQAGRVPFALHLTNAAGGATHLVQVGVAATTSDGQVTAGFDDAAAVQRLVLAPGASRTLNGWVEPNVQRYPSTLAVQISVQELIEDVAPGGQIETAHGATLVVSAVQPLVDPSAVLSRAPTGGAVAITSPQSGWIAPGRRIAVTVQGASADRLSLAVNGGEVAANQIGKTVKDPKADRLTLTYFNVELQPGDNTLTLAADGKGGRREQSLVVYAPGQATGVQPLAPASPLSRDEYRRQQVLLLVTDSGGLPAPDGVMLSLSTRDARILGRDADPKQPGFQVRTQGGQAALELAPNLSVNERYTLRATMGTTPFDLAIPVHWERQAPITSGSVDVTVAPQAAAPIHSEGAAFTSRRLANGWELTARYSTYPQAKAVRTSDELEAWTLTGDTSRVTDAAPSADPLYVRLKGPTTSLLYGDLTTDWRRATAFTNRGGTATGLELETMQGDVHLRGYLYPSRWAQKREILLGKGISGPYFLAEQGVAPGSETVWLRTVQPDLAGHPSDVVLSRRALERGTDYEINESLGTLSFTSPVPSRDTDLNFVEIEVVYGVPGTVQSGFVYGARAELTHDGLHVGAGVTGSQTVLDGEQGAAGLDVGLTGRAGSAAVEAAASRDGAGHSGQAGTVSLRWTPAPRLRLGVSARGITGSYVLPGAAAAPLAAGYQVNGDAEWTLAAALKAKAEKSVEGKWTGELRGTDQIGLGVTLSPNLSGDALWVSKGDGPDATGAGRRRSLVLDGKWQLAERTLLSFTQPVAVPGSAVAVQPELKIEQKLNDAVTAAVAYEGPGGAETADSAVVFSLEGRPQRGPEWHTQYRIPGVISGRSNQIVLGGKDRWQLAPGLFLGLSAEQTRTNENGTPEVASAATGSVEYVGSRDFKLTITHELRDDAGSTFHSTAFNVDGRLRDSLSYVLKLQSYDGGGPLSGNRRLLFEGRAGLAYRDDVHSRTTALLQWNARRYALGTKFPGAAPELNVGVAALDIAHTTARGIALNSTLALKTQSEAAPAPIATEVGLAQIGAQFPLTSRLQLGLYERALFDQAGGARHGSAVELTVMMSENVGISLGTSSLAVDDPDLQSVAAWPEGVYLRTQIKF